MNNKCCQFIVDGHRYKAASGGPVSANSSDLEIHLG